MQCRNVWVPARCEPFLCRLETLPAFHGDAKIDLAPFWMVRRLAEFLDLGKERLDEPLVDGMARIASSPYINGTISTDGGVYCAGPSSIRLARYDRQCVRMKPQIVPMAIGGMGVVDLPDVLVVEFDFAPTCEALVAQHGLDAGSLLGSGGPVGKDISGQQRSCGQDETE